MQCDKCNHEHQGERLGYICIGCPCDERPGAKDNKAYTLAMRIADIADENCGMQPVSTPDELLGVIESELRKQSREIERMRPVYDIARRWCNRPLSVLREGATVLRNDADMFAKLHARFDFEKSREVTHGAAVNATAPETASAAQDTPRERQEKEQG